MTEWAAGAGRQLTETVEFDEQVTYRGSDRHAGSGLVSAALAGGERAWGWPVALAAIPVQN